MLADDKRVVPLTLLAQAGVSLGLAVLLGFWQGRVVAASIVLGGMIAVVPNAFLAARLLRPSDPSAAALMRAAWIGGIGKWLLTAGLFAAVFASVRPLSAAGVLAGFIAAQLVVFAALKGKS